MQVIQISSNNINMVQFFNAIGQQPEKRNEQYKNGNYATQTI